MKNKFNFLEFFQSMKSTLLVTILLFTCVSVWGASPLTIAGSDITGFGSGTNYTSGEFDADDGVKISSTGAFSTDQFRIGKSKNLVISIANNLITKVEITVSGTGYKLNADNLSYSNTVGTYSNQDGVASVTFSNSNNNIARITEIKITYGSSCAAPSATSNGTITKNSATVSWTSDKEAWDIYYSDVNTAPTTQSGTAVNTNPSYTFTGLSASTTYYWWVRTNCGSGSTSTWKAGSAFTTSSITYTDYITECGTYPSISVSPASITGLGYVYGSAASASTVKTFAVTGSYLTPANKVTVSAPSGFEVKADGEFANNVELTPANDGSLNATISVRLSSGKTVSDSYSGNVTISSADIAESKTVALSATVTRAPLATPSNFEATAISLAANLSWSPVEHADGYKVEYSDGGDYVVAEVTPTLVSEKMTCSVTGLGSCTEYLWKVTAIANNDNPTYKSGVAAEINDFSTLGYNVTVTVNNVVEDKDNAYKAGVAKEFDCDGSGITLSYTASSDYVLPTDVDVYIGGVKQVNAEGYYWYVYEGEGVIGINKDAVAGAVAITITAMSNNPATVTFNAGNGNCDTEKLTESSKGAGITLPTASPSTKCAALGWEFAGWSLTQQTEATTTSPTIIPQNETYYPASDVPLYAVYKFTEAGSTEWIRATKVTDVTAGGTFILGYEADYTNNKGVIVPMRNEGNDKLTGEKDGILYSGTTAGSSTNGTITMSTVEATSAYEITIAASTSVQDAVVMKIGNKFIGNANKKNSCQLFEAESANTAFNVAVGANNVFTFTISANTGQSANYPYLKFNNISGTYRYAVYSSTSENLVLYKKKVNSVTTYIASPECSSTAITLDRGTQGQANGSAVAQKGSKNLANFTGVTLEVENSYILNGYYSAASDGVKVIDAEGKLLADVSGYTNANGEWTRDDEDLTLYAQWTANTFDITLAKNTGDANGSARVTYGATAVYDLNKSGLVKTGYELTGFKGGSVIVLNADGTFAADNVDGYITDGKWSRVGNVTLDAQWQGAAVELSFNDNGTITPVQTNVGTKIQLPDLTKGCAGYSNVGWTTVPPVDNGWATKPAIKQGGSNYTVESGVTTFYAVYSEGTGDPNLFEKVETASDFTEDGTYMLVWNDEQTSKFFAMGNNFDSEENTWATTEVSVSDNQISNTNNAYCWTFKNNNADKYSMKNVGDNSYVICNADKYFEASATAGYTFAISFSNGVVTLSSADCEDDWYSMHMNAFLSGKIDNVSNEEVFGINILDNTNDNYLFKQTGSTSYISNPDCREISSITIADESTAETEYYTDETFNPAGLVIQINYTSGEPKKVTYSQSIADDFTFSPALTEYLKTSDKQEKITYGGFDAYLDITVTVRPSYTVTYDMNGRAGVAPTEVPQYEGTQITIKAAPEVSGQYFGGWKASTDGEIYNAGDLYTMTAENVVFTAQWTTAFIYKKVTDASTLMDGDQIIIANYSLGIAMGSYNSSKYYEPASVVFDNEETTTSVTNDVTVFTLVASNDKWKMKTANGLYLSEGSNKLVLGNTQDEWTISISSGVTSIKVSSNYGPIKCNTNSSNRYACYTSTQSMSVPSIYRKLAYTRAASKFSNGTISTVCLPYGVCQGDFYGCTVYEITGKELKDGDPYKVFFDQVFSMEAGKPYVVELDENATEAKFFYSGTAVDEPNNENTNGLVGTFTAIDDELNGNTVLMGNYMIYGNQIKKCGTGCLVGANKAYIVMDEVPEENGSSTAPGRRLTLGVEQAQTPTGVEMQNAECTMQDVRKVIVNNQMFIIRGGKMYNASGALVK